MRRQPVRQRQHARSQKRKDCDPGCLNLVRCNQSVAFFFGFHFSEVCPRSDEPRTFSGIVWRTRLRFKRLVTQITDIATHGPDEIILPTFGLRDHTLSAQLLHPPFREIQKPRNDADGLGRC